VDAVKVDAEGRILPTALKPGDYYEPAFVGPDVITLLKVASPPGREPFSADDMRQAEDRGRRCRKARAELRPACPGLPTG